MPGVKTSRSFDTTKVKDYWNQNPLGTQFCVDPDVAIGSPEFFDQIRPHMTQRFPWIVDLIDTWGPQLKRQRLLEVGCGLGFDTIRWASHGVDVTAIDLSTESLELARQHARLRRAPIHFQEGSALQLPFDDESFDVVYSRGVLHHTGDTPRAISEVYRVLRPGGRAFCCHFYRRNSWMHLISSWGREPIEFKEGDPPVTTWYSVADTERMFNRFSEREFHLQHYRAIKTLRRGVKAALFNYVFCPVFNRLPERLARKLAYKISVYALK